MPLGDASSSFVSAVGISELFRLVFECLSITNSSFSIRNPFTQPSGIFDHSRASRDFAFSGLPNRGSRNQPRLALTEPLNSLSFEVFHDSVRVIAFQNCIKS